MKFRIRDILSILFFIACLFQEIAGETKGFTLEEFVERALAKDSRVIETRLGREVAEARQKANLAIPDSEISLSYGTDAFGNDEGERALGLSLSQPFRLPQQKKALREIANAGTALAVASQQEADWLAKMEAKQLFHRLLAARQRLELSQKATKLSNELARFVATAAARGEASKIDAGRTHLKSLEANETHFAHEQAYNELVGNARAMLRLEQAAELIIEGTLEFPEARILPPNDLLDLKSTRPDLMKASHEEERAAAKLRATKSKRWGNWALQAYVEHAREIDSPDGLQRERSHGVALSVILPWWGRGRAELQAARAEAKTSSMHRDALTQSIVFELKTAVEREVSLFRRLSRFKDTITPLAEKNAVEALEAFSLGQVSLQQVLMMREEALRLQGTFLDLLLEYHLAAIRLEAALGK